ncbi:hypothetical protein V8G54_000489 [Vigna mungo]|uniref:Uncharacterized protein n=1 Tax=Vigna mungo TaxID=3915 RepID=A0AAQ3P5D3_VIGMU
MIHCSHRFNLLLKLLLRNRHILQPLHRHHWPCLQHRLIRRPESSFPQNLRRSPEQILQIERPSRIPEKHQLLRCPTTVHFRLVPRRNSSHSRRRIAVGMTAVLDIRNPLLRKNRSIGLRMFDSSNVDRAGLLGSFAPAQEN